jgi:hypothetical protein
MTKVMNDVREVAKNDRNTQQNFSFRGIDAVVNAVAPALRKHGVVVMPTLVTIDYLPFQSSKGTAMMCARVVVAYTFVGPGGDMLRTTVPGEAMDAGDKATAKAMSVAFRTALLQSLALPTDDVDPDAESYNVGESTARKSGQAAPDAAASPAPVGESAPRAPRPVAGTNADPAAPAGAEGTRR